MPGRRACLVTIALIATTLTGLAGCALPPPHLHLAGLVHLSTPTAILTLTLTLAPSPTPPPPLDQPTDTATPDPGAQLGPMITLTPSTVDYCTNDPPQKGSCILPHQFLLHSPIPPEYNDWVAPTYRYGSTQEGTRDAHHGVELENPVGTPVIAAAAGKVIFAGSDDVQAISPWLNAYGNAVIVQHQFDQVDQPVFTVYGHLSSVLVKVGQAVQQGDTLGLVGQTGAAVGPHLHFEVRVGKNTFDSTSNPELWLIPHIDPNGLMYGVLAGQLLPRDNADHPMATLSLIRIEGNALSKETRFIAAYPWELVRNKGVWQEHFAVGSLAAGQYRLAVMIHGKLYVQIVQIYPGQVTWAVFNTNLK